MIDPITLEVARNRFSAVADAMEALLRRHYYASTMPEAGVSLSLRCRGILAERPS